MDLDTYYRAFTEYKKQTQEDRDCANLNKAISSSDTVNDRIEILKTNCIIDEDWIEAIEEGLVHVEKAIAEERQFIRSNGEVVPIERVKQVSKDSVDHLARHSNLLTRLPDEGKDIIPDQLYTVERLSDFAVYENRFLYMMLCFLRDFIAFRYDKIVELTNTYNGKLTMSKRVHRGDRALAFEVKLAEEIKNDKFLKERNPLKDKIDRIDLIYKTVLAFLNTPLMEWVSKTPMLKPPITETNVLRMNKNFKGAKELYYFISSYTKQGFTAEQTIEVMAPFSEGIAEEFAEGIALNSFLVYKNGLGIEKVLKEEYERGQEELKKKEEQEKSEQLEALKRKIKQSGKTQDEYILLLEQRNKQLETSGARLEAMIEANSKLAGENKNLTTNVNELKEKIEEQENSHSEEVKKLNDEHSQTLQEKENTYNEELKKLTQECTDKITASKKECEDKITANKKECANKISANVKATQEKLKAYKSTLEKLNKVTTEKNLLEARLNALLYEKGLHSTQENFTTPESFAQIEEQYKAFKSFFKGEWKSAKKQIRKEILNVENIKKLSEKNYEYKTPQSAVDLEKVFGKPKPQKIAPKQDKKENSLNKNNLLTERIEDKDE